MYLQIFSPPRNERLLMTAKPLIRRVAEEAFDTTHMPRISWGRSQDWNRTDNLIVVPKRHHDWIDEPERLARQVVLISCWHVCQAIREGQDLFEGWR